VGAICPRCSAPVIEVDVKCGSCGAPLGTTGAHRLVGHTLLGQYKVLEMIGQGGMSTVYRAVHDVTEQEVALKVLPPDLAALGQVKSRFLEEARALAQLDHPNIVHLYNFGSEGGSVVLAMQFIAGQTWERMILAEDGQPWPEAVRIAIDVLRALEYAHARGIVHRDMKPSNVLVRAGDGSATVMDFGIAKMTSSTRLTATGQTMGTVRYMSPEQVRGQDVDLRSDIYSLGATLYEAIAGDTPFDGNTHFEIMTKHLTEAPRSLRALGKEVPEALDAAILKALAKRPAERFATARALRKDLEAILRDSGAAAEIAETQRLSRKMLPASTQPPVRRGAAAARPSAPPSSPAAPPAASSPPIAVAGPAGPPVETTSLPPPTAQVRVRASRLWPALAIVVGLAGGGVAYLGLRGKPAPRSPFAGTVEPAPPAVVSWGAVADFPDLPLRVRIARGVAVEPETVAGAYRRARAALPAVLEARHVAAPQFPDPVTIGVVPPGVFCDPGLYDGATPERCTEMLHYFRVRDPILLIADRPALLGRIVAQAVAEVSCTYNDVSPCFDRALIEATDLAGDAGRPR
jgi:serine/threonine-protein kinase